MVFELVQPAKHWMFEAEESFAAGVVLVQEGRTAGQTEKDGRRSGHPRNTQQHAYAYATPGRPVELPAETILHAIWRSVINKTQGRRSQLFGRSE